MDYDELEKLTNQHPIDIGDKCVDCRQDTSFGTGRFVNRIPAFVDREVDGKWLELDGYLCAECREMECEGKDCDYMVLDDYTIIDGTVLCNTCVEKIPAEEKLRLQKEQLAWFD